MSDITKEQVLGWLSSEVARCDVLILAAKKSRDMGALSSLILRQETLRFCLGLIKGDM